MPLSRSNSCIDIDFTLRRKFKKSAFRPLQRDVIVEALDGKDVFVQAATSFGKSLCFQLPAVIDHGITIVISPLLSLMTDQTNALKAAGIEASSINYHTPYSEKQRILRDLATGHPITRLLYVTPEQCATENFRSHLKLVHEQQELARIAVDEAHCISEWGHDFRPSFKELRWFRATFPDVPIICLTATATLQVRQDVITTLGLSEDNLKVFTMTTNRKNLHYEVRFKCDEEDHYNDFLSWLKGIHKRRAENVGRRQELERVNERLDNVSGIIYALYRSDCDNLAARLRSDGIGAKPYHAGLPNDEKKETLKRWVNNDKGFDVIVATTAFGMGIDKENVRFVAHWQLPKSFEGYYQEAGRAGRDGKASACIMYYSREDRDRAYNRLSRDAKEKNSNLEARMKSLQALVNYCEDIETCRHKMICRYFGEKDVPECDYACDWHKDPKGLKRAKDKGLKDEEWVSTQREMGRFDNSYEGYD
ncbi:ATP-dependent DNA helicase [Lachnellula hyalina]|uniref:ATP-dependent DNA helicase n=1 Tax=Lachnellula hyalina TaxID=1316788 RepID=A0A8H8R8R9_9HELO|nr:ATP-dependent DNA helicase [Lachnellula hyalina]TVY30571.1 ATP-dependent DNA helicase [Lachnellula hyalina]